MKECLKFESLTSDEQFMKLALETSDNYIIATDLVEETIGKLTTAATQEDAADFKGNSFEALMGIMVTKLRDRKRKKF